jgi:hypothetical protein
MVNPRAQKISAILVPNCRLRCFSRRAIHITNQPRLSTGKSAVISQRKGNPMKANTRHVAGSTRSCRTALPRSVTQSQRFQIRPEKSVQNPYKSNHFPECEFANHSSSTTYNFNVLKCTDFSVLPAGNLTPNLTFRGRDSSSERPPIAFAIRREVRLLNSALCTVSSALKRAGQSRYCIYAKPKPNKTE